MTGIEIEVDVPVGLDPLQGSTSARDFELVVEIDGRQHVAGCDAAHFFSCAAGTHCVEVHVRSRSGVRPEWMVDGHASLFVNEDVPVTDGRTTRLHYVGDARWLATGDGSVEQTLGKR